MNYFLTVISTSNLLPSKSWITAFIVLDFLGDFLLLCSSDVSEADTLAGVGPEVVVPVLLSLDGSCKIKYEINKKNRKKIIFSD